MRLSWTTESSSCLTVMTLVGFLSATTGLPLAGDGCEVGVCCNLTEDVKAAKWVRVPLEAPAPIAQFDTTIKVF